MASTAAAQIVAPAQPTAVPARAATERVRATPELSAATTETGADAPEAAIVTATHDESDGPEWPDEEVESAMRVEHRERDRALPTDAKPKAPAAERAASADEEVTLPLPKLDSLIEQIPPQVRETLEELFRARFTSVQRVPKAALK